MSAPITHRGKRSIESRVKRFKRWTWLQKSRTACVPEDSRLAKSEPRVSSRPRNEHSSTQHQKHIKLATFNVRTIRHENRRLELVKLASDLQIDVLAVQEHRLRDVSTVPQQQPNGYSFLASDADENGNGGIGFLISNKCKNTILDCQYINARCAHLTLALADRRMHVVCVYAPPAVLQHEDETMQLYDSLNNLLSSLPRRDQIFLCGDFNATLPVDGIRVKNRCGKKNLNTERLTSFMSTHDLIATNGVLRQRSMKRLATFHGPNDRSTRLDWILCSRRFISCLRKVQVIRPKVVQSDHNVVIMSVDLKWLKFRRPPLALDWQTLVNDTDIRHNFLESYDATNKSNTDLIVLLNQVAEKTVPAVRPCNPVSHWINDTELEKSRRQLQSVADKQGVNSDATRTARANYEKTMSDCAENFVDHMVNEVENHTLSQRHSAAWKIVNQIAGRKRQPVSIISARSAEDVKQKIADHYSSVLNACSQDSKPSLEVASSDNCCSTENADNEEISATEVRLALKTMQKTKTAGPDGIPSVVLKMPELESDVADYLTRHWQSTDMPEFWKRSVITSIPKRGNSTALDNQRGIAKTATIVKTMNKVLLNRILPIVNPQLLPLQSGFRPGRSATENIMALRYVLDICRTTKRSASIVFIDFRKAFDSIRRDIIADILALYSVPANVQKCISNLYTGTSAKVQTTFGETEYFQTSSGVLQGDTLSPFLFITVLDYVLRTTLRDEDGFVVATRRSSRYPEVVVSALAYADDIAIMTPDPETASRVVDRLEKCARTVGLRINYDKSFVLHAGDIDVNTSLQLKSGAVIRPTTSFKYLGINTDDASSVVAERRGSAWTAAIALRSIFCSNAKDRTKIRLFRAVVESVFAYGLETLPMTPTMESNINASYRQLQRYALGIRYPDKISDECLKNRTRLDDFSNILEGRRRNLVGHVLRMKNRSHTPLCKLIESYPTDRRRRGHGRTITLHKTIFKC